MPGTWMLSWPTSTPASSVPTTVPKLKPPILSFPMRKPRARVRKIASSGLWRSAFTNQLIRPLLLPPSVPPSLAPRGHGPIAVAGLPNPSGSESSLLGGLVERDGQRARVGDLDEIADLQGLEILGITRLHGLGVAVWSLDRNGVRHLVDGDDRHGHGDLLPDGARRRLARLRCGYTL